MNQEAKEYLEKILEKRPLELSHEEVAFLKARRSYLKEAQLKEYESIINPKEVKPNPAEGGTVKNKNDEKPR